MRITTPPIIEPVSITDAKNWLRVDYDGEDVLIESLISAAREKCEQYTNRAFISQGITESYGINDDIILSRGEVISVDSVTVGDVVLAATDYTTDDGVDGFFITLKNLPDDRVTVVYTAGYGENASDVPRTIVAAIWLMVGDMEANRSDKVRRLPTASENLLNTVRRWVT